MAKGIYVQEGKVIDWANGTNADVAYHDVVPLTGRIGVANEAIAKSATGAVAVTGVWELPAVNNAAFAVGDALYWDATNGNLTKVATDNTAAGWCVAVKAEAGTTAKVKIG